MKTTLAVAAVVAAVTLVQAQDRAVTVLGQVRSALGGEQKLAAIKALSVEGASRRALGTRTVEGSTTLLMVRPDKLRRSDESSMFGSSSERISTFDGTQAWDETVNAARVGGGGGGDHDHGAGGFAGAFGGPDHNHADGFQGRGSADAAANGALTAEQVDAARARRMKMELQRWTIAFLADSHQPFTDAGTANSPDGPADVLETTDEAGRAVRLFIDPANHMPLMVQYQEIRAQALPAQGGAPKTTTVALHLADYKKVDGVMLPHLIETSVNGQPSESWTIEKFKINPSVKAGVFQKKAK